MMRQQADEGQEVTDAEQALQKRMASLDIRPGLHNLRYALGSPERIARMTGEASVTRIIGDVRKCIEVTSKAGDLKGLFDYCFVLGDQAPIVQKIKEGHQLSEFGHDIFDVFEMVLKSGDEEAIERASPEYFSKDPRGFAATAHAPYFADKLQEVGRRFQAYCERNGLGANTHYNLEYLLNAAYEIMKGKYDLVICVLNGGSGLPEFLEMLGQPTRYLEWHRKDSQKAPEWRAIGRDTSPVASAGKILICENDAETGSTLTAIIPTLKKLGAKEVDVCFSIDRLQKNEEVMRREDIAKFYGRSLNIEAMDTTNFHEYLKDFLKRPREEEGSS